MVQRMEGKVSVLIHLYSSQKDYSLQILVTYALRLLFTHDKLIMPSFPNTNCLS